MTVVRHIYCSYIVTEISANGIKEQVFSLFAEDEMGFKQKMSRSQGIFKKNNKKPRKS